MAEGLSENNPMDEADMDVLWAFRDKEQSLGRWSQDVTYRILGPIIRKIFMILQGFSICL